MIDFRYLKEEVNADTSRFPIGHDDLILQYLYDRDRWADGERLGRQMRTECKDNNQPMLTDAAAACMRQILFSYKVKISKFNGLLNSFAVLLMNRGLEQDEFNSTRNLRLWMERLSRIDMYYRSIEDKEYFCKPSRYGAPLCWGVTADDTQHGSKTDAKSHVALRSRAFPVSEELDEEFGKGFMVSAAW